MSKESPNCSRGRIPLLVRRGGRASKKMVPFRKGADGVVARESRFAVRFETFACERPPRLREIRWLRDFFIERAATSRGGECAQPNSLIIRSHVLSPVLPMP